MSITVNVSDELVSMMRGYANSYGITLDQAIENAIIEKLEDAIDLKLYEKAMEEHKKDGRTYTHDDIVKRLGL